MNAEESSTSPIVLFVSPDLLFAGKIQGAASPLGMRVLQESQVAGAARVLADQAVAIVLLDLNVSGLSVSEIISLLPSENRPMVVAFGPHVNTVRLEEARQAGCDRVLPRSRFVVELPALLKQALGTG